MPTEKYLRKVQKEIEKKSYLFLNNSHDEAIKNWFFGHLGKIGLDESLW